MRSETQMFVFSRLGILFAIALSTLVVSSSQADAITYYISPTGSDSNSGTSSSSPWKTFNFAIPKLRPGDTLLLRNGTYSGSNTGILTINCGSNANNGTQSQPITIKAENERQAHIVANGLSIGFDIRNCSHYIIAGLRISGPTTGWRFTDLWPNVSDSTFRRLLMHDLNLINGTRVNSHGLILDKSTRILVEENECYNFDRALHPRRETPDSIFRRNYGNMRLSTASIQRKLSDYLPGQ